MKKRKVYISGQISQLPRDEYIARFAKAEELLRDEGYTPVNPTKFLPCRWPWLFRLMGYKLTIMYDLWQLSRCDLIYKIPGWRESKGANIESCWAFNFNIWILHPTTREKIDKKMAKYLHSKETRREGVDNEPKTLHHGEK